jgi:hypothetical protein
LMRLSRFRRLSALMLVFNHDTKLMRMFLLKVNIPI